VERSKTAKVAGKQNADPVHALLLLSARRERPSHRRAANQGYELTSFQLTEFHAQLLAKEPMAE
jgi:hypothetical protein